MAFSSIRSQLDMLLAVAVLPAAATTALALWMGGKGDVANGPPAAFSPPGALVVALLLACSWAAALWLARRLASTVARTDAARSMRPSDRGGGLAPRELTPGAVRRLQELQHQASHDELTGLVNRRAFDAILRQRMASCGLDGSGLTLLYIDIDGFKRINDEHGHAIGDQLLRLFAARLRARLRHGEVVARLGGDEFAVILGNASSAEAVGIADGLIERLSSPYRLGGRILEVSASIGLAACAEAGHSAAGLLAAADGAMYDAKRAGKRRHGTSGLAPLWAPSGHWDAMPGNG